jgi:hypothetical protein
MRTGEIEMITGHSGNAVSIQGKTGWRTLLPLFFTFIFAMSLWPARTQAQIVGNVAAEIPFQFHVGNKTFPAGNYVIHQLDNSDLTIMQIRSADGKLSALFNVESAQAKATPEITELIFNKYGDQYFLSEMFDEGEPDGSKVVPSKDEKRASIGSNAQIASVTAMHPLQAGK